MTTQPALTAHADQLAATLRDRRPHHDDTDCDALFPCRSCRTQRLTVQVARHVVAIPEQRRP